MAASDIIKNLANNPGPIASEVTAGPALKPFAVRRIVVIETAESNALSDFVRAVLHARLRIIEC